MFRKASAANIKPIARTEGLSITASGDETLVYDREQFVIHRLSPEMAAVWQIADGSRDLAAISVETGVRNVEETVQSLVAIGLVQGEPVRKSLVSRRRIMAGAAGAAAAGTFISAYAAVSGDRCNNQSTCKDMTCPTGYQGRCSDTSGPPPGKGVCQCVPN